MAVRPIDANAMLNELKPLGFEAEHSAVILSDVSKMMREWVERQPTLTPPNEPLTIEQLREMDGQPVWVRVSDNWRESGIYEGWMLIRFHSEDDRIRAYTYDTRFGATFHAQQDYGTSWIAYAYTPAYIDREAKNKKRLINWDCGICRIPEWAMHYWKRGFKYCPHCGRALTPGAMYELEKRLRG